LEAGEINWTVFCKYFCMTSEKIYMPCLLSLADGTYLGKENKKVAYRQTFPLYNSLR